MKRRTFIKDAAMATAAAFVAPEILSATESYSPFSADGEQPGGDFKIVSDEVKDNVRYITATPSSIVCSSQIDIEIDLETGKIANCKFTRGCPGNAVGLCRLIKGMKPAEVSETLLGTPCAKKGTSCPDQLARILASLK